MGSQDYESETNYYINNYTSVEAVRVGGLEIDIRSDLIKSILGIWNLTENVIAKRNRYVFMHDPNAIRAVRVAMQRYIEYMKHPQGENESLSKDQKDIINFCTGELERTPLLFLQCVFSDTGGSITDALYRTTYPRPFVIPLDEPALSLFWKDVYRHENERRRFMVKSKLSVDCYVQRLALPVRRALRRSLPYQESQGSKLSRKLLFDEKFTTRLGSVPDISVPISLGLDFAQETNEDGNDTKKESPGKQASEEMKTERTGLSVSETGSESVSNECQQAAPIQAELQRLVIDPALYTMHNPKRLVKNPGSVMVNPSKKPDLRNIK